MNTKPSNVNRANLERNINRISLFTSFVIFSIISTYTTQIGFSLVWKESILSWALSIAIHLFMFYLHLILFSDRRRNIGLINIIVAYCMIGLISAFFNFNAIYYEIMSSSNIEYSPFTIITESIQIIKGGQNYPTFFKFILSVMLTIMIDTPIFVVFVTLRLTSVKKISQHVMSQDKLLVEIMFQKKAKKLFSLCIFLLILLVGYFIGVEFNLFSFSIELILITIFLLSALNILLVTLKYRITKGFYGENPHEAREIMLFLLKESEKEDFDDKNGGKRVLTERENYRAVLNGLIDELGEAI